MQTAWVRTGNEKWLRATKFFGKLFLINFAMGVVTGIVQEFQFGMNWSDYSRFVGDIFGAPLAIEGLLAFFLESTFLGLWIFGWDRLPKKLHLATIWLASIGTMLSAYFILAANSWMQHPVGYTFNEAGGPRRADRLRGGADPEHGGDRLRPHACRRCVHDRRLAGRRHLAVPAAQGQGRRHRPLDAAPRRWSPRWSPAVAVGHHRRHRRQDHDRAAADEDGRRRGAVRDGAARAVLAAHDRHARRLRAGLRASTSPACCPSWPPAASTARSRASTTSTSSTTSSSPGPGWTTSRPNIPLTYWTFRLMIGFGMAAAPWSPWALWAYRTGSADADQQVGLPRGDRRAAAAAAGQLASAGSSPRWAASRGSCSG